MESFSLHTLLLGGLSGGNFLLIIYILKKISKLDEKVSYIKGFIDAGQSKGRGRIL